MTPVAVPRARLHRPDLRVEKSLLRNGCQRLAAMDEVGRGALAGPVSIGVVVVTDGIGRVPLGLRDSKLLTPAARELLVSPIRRWVVEWAVGHASAAEIDRYGIMAALRTAGRRALAALSAPVDAVLLDGNHDYLNTPAQTALFDEPDVPPDVAAAPRVPVHLRIKADLHCAAVAGASVLAKTERDGMMVGFGGDFPAYGWAVNKGYATPDHLAAIAELGPSELHRRSWRLTGPVVLSDDGTGRPVGDDENTIVGPADRPRHQVEDASA